MYKLIALLFIYLTTASSPLWAGEPEFNQGYSLPKQYPSTFEDRGILQQIHLSERRLIIDASPIQLDLNTPVHLLDLYSATLQNLKPGMPIGFSTRIQNGIELITEIWELPPNAVPLS